MMIHSRTATVNPASSPNIKTVAFLAPTADLSANKFIHMSLYSTVPLHQTDLPSEAYIKLQRIHGGNGNQERRNMTKQHKFNFFGLFIQNAHVS